MNMKDKFERLIELEFNARSDKERAEVQNEFDQLATQDLDGFEGAFIECVSLTLFKAKRLKIKEQRSEVSGIVLM